VKNVRKDEENEVWIFFFFFNQECCSKGATTTKISLTNKKVYTKREGGPNPLKRSKSKAWHSKLVLK
jgi:hypothetical protein